MSTKQMVTRQQRNNFINTKDLGLLLVCVCMCVCSCICYIVRTNSTDLSTGTVGRFLVTEDILSGQVSESPYKGSSTRFCLHVSVSAFLV